MRTVRYDELALIIILGALQPLTEVLFGMRMASLYNVAAAIIVLLWIAVRLTREPGLLHPWGMRFDNFRRALPVYLGFAFLSGQAVFVWGWLHGLTPLPASFWYLLALYLLWGLAQQFALQNFLARNLSALLPNIFARSAVTALLFSLAHAPSVPLMILSCIAGFFFTVLYTRIPNLFAAGIAHGILGALVFYLVLGQDQIEVLKQYLIQQ